MANWQSCTDPNGRPVYVNLDNATWIAKIEEDATRIGFPGSQQEYVVVTETPEKLLGLQSTR